MVPLLTADEKALSFGIQSIDHAFQGLKPGDFATLHGHPFCKTLMFKLCVQCQLPKEKGGFDSSTIYVDGGNSFNPYKISAIARDFGSDPRSTLERVFVSRAFTAYQLSAIILETLEDALKRYRSKLVLISNITSLFLDRDVPTKEALEIYQKMIIHLADLALRRSIIVVATCSDSGHSKRQIVLESILLGKACKTARFTEAKGRIQVAIQNRGFPRSLQLDILPNEATLEKFVEA